MDITYKLIYDWFLGGMKLGRNDGRITYNFNKHSWGHLTNYLESDVLMARYYNG
jgi:hypothetical protein